MYMYIYIYMYVCIHRNLKFTYETAQKSVKF